VNGWERGNRAPGRLFDERYVPPAAPEPPEPEFKLNVSGLFTFLLGVLAFSELADVAFRLFLFLRGVW
jgi:hypothetical protein